MNYKRTKLDNGLRLLTAPMPGMRSASIAFFFTVGSRYERDEIAGISHFIEHMLFKGSWNYPTARLLSESIEGIGGTFNASTGKELTSYTARVPAEYLAEALQVMGDMVLHPLFDLNEMEKERNVIIEEINATYDDPQEWANLLIDEVMWEGLPLGRDDAGSVETVARLQRQQLIEYHTIYYRPNSLVLSIAGNIDQQQVEDLVEQLFGTWEAGEHPHWLESLPPRHPAQPVKIVKKATEQSNICLATLGIPYTSADYYPFMLINTILGEGMSSRLFQTIREERGLAYDIGSYFNSYYDTGSFVVSAGVEPRRVEETIRATLLELKHVCDEPVSSEELERAKAYMRGGILLGLEGTQQVASWLGSQESLRDHVRDIDEMIARVNAVTAQDIQRVARACFAPEWRRLVLIGPEDARRAGYFEKLLTSV
jgi:predicted Zn-dependent peptidase